MLTLVCMAKGESRSAEIMWELLKAANSAVQVLSLLWYDLLFESTSDMIMYFL